MVSKTAFFHDEKTLWHFGAVHAGNLPAGGWVQPSGSGFMAEAPEPKRRIVSLLDVSGLMSQLDRRSSSPASDEELRRVHTSAYLSDFRSKSAAGGGIIGHDASFGPGGYDVAALSAGLAIGALDAVWSHDAENAYAMSRPPGHHCLPNEGMGFCLLANVAIAVEAAIANHSLSRVAIIDIDVHHGNGTQTIFYDRPDILTISVHQENCYPPGSGQSHERGADRGMGYNVNVPLLAGGGDRAYADAFELIVLPMLRAYKPEVIVIAAGFDANALDPLARMQAHSGTFAMMMAQLKAAAKDLCGGRIVVVHEGGYSEAYVPFCANAAIAELAGLVSPVEDPILDFVRQQQPGEEFNAFQRALLVKQAGALGLAEADVR
jgi:acetoin utilization deacetylase AcuC-like enzyme